MPVHVLWDNEEKNIIRWDFEATWTIEEYFTANSKSDQLINAVNQPVAIIVNCQSIQKYPPNLLSLARSSLQTTPKNLACSIIVSQSGFIELLVATIQQLSLFTIEVRHVCTIESAREYATTIYAQKL